VRKTVTQNQYHTMSPGKDIISGLKYR